MMGRALTTQERAQRQRAMIEFRNWMESHGVPRKEAAGHLGITVGHLSTLINANRTPSQDQVDAAWRMMNGAPPVPPKVKVSKAKPKRRSGGRKKSTKSAPRPTKPNNLRPMNKFECEFVVEVAKSWIASNPNASKDDLVDVVRALSIGIRS